MSLGAAAAKGLRVRAAGLVPRLATRLTKPVVAFQRWPTPRSNPIKVESEEATLKKNAIVLPDPVACRAQLPHGGPGQSNSTMMGSLAASRHRTPYR
jgi:hypothetical protein